MERLALRILLMIFPGGLHHSCCWSLPHPLLSFQDIKVEHKKRSPWKYVHQWHEADSSKCALFGESGNAEEAFTHSFFYLFLKACSKRQHHMKGCLGSTFSNLVIYFYCWTQADGLLCMNKLGERERERLIQPVIGEDDWKLWEGHISTSKLS